MSNFRQTDEDVLVRTYALTFSRNSLVPPISEAWDQLIYATRGVLTVSAPHGTWVVPPYRALWLPANTPCTLQVGGSTALRMLYLRPTGQTKCVVLSVTPLLREMILRTVKIGSLKKDDAMHRRLAGLIHDELQSVDVVPLQLPYPSDTQAAKFADLMAALPDIDDAIRQSGVSRRTMERIFRAETGMSLGQWVRRRKLLRGLQNLAEGETIASVAFSLGYNGPSAFIAMFKRELGATPGAYLAGG